MLKDDMIQAAKEGKFHSYPVKTIAEGIGVLTGVKAENKLPDGTWEKATVNYLVNKCINEIADRMEEYQRMPSGIR